MSPGAAEARSETAPRDTAPRDTALHDMTPHDTTLHAIALHDATPRVCAITGADGYVGSRVADRLAGAGWSVTALSRAREARARTGFRRIHCDLGGELEPGAFAGVDALVHAAYDFGVTRRADVERVNVAGSRRLFDAARGAGVARIVFLSTVAAFPGARSLYGRAKLEIERAALAAGAAVVRPGLVWGPGRAVPSGALGAAVERLPIVPLPFPPALELSLVHEDDLAALVQRILDRWPEGSEKLFVAASEETVGFVALLRARALRAGRRPRFVWVPWRAAWLGLRALETMGVATPFPSDNLVGMVAGERHPLVHATGDAARYGVSFRPHPDA
jgi:nucleoside-diphosphate-sugar epimerase